MSDPFACRCEEPNLWPQCASRATQEDMLCDDCRKYRQAMAGTEYAPEMKNAYLGIHYAWHRYRPSWLSGGASFVGGNYTPYEPR